VVTVIEPPLASCQIAGTDDANIWRSQDTHDEQIPPVIGVAEGPVALTPTDDVGAIVKHLLRLFWEHTVPLSEVFDVTFIPLELRE